MVALALVNRLRSLRACVQDSAKLARSVAAEQAIGFAILAIVSVLGTWPPAAGHAM